MSAKPKTVDVKRSRRSTYSLVKLVHESKTPAGSDAKAFLFNSLGHLHRQLNHGASGSIAQRTESTSFSVTQRYRRAARSRRWCSSRCSRCESQCEHMSTHNKTAEACSLHDAGDLQQVSGRTDMSKMSASQIPQWVEKSRRCCSSPWNNPTHPHPHGTTPTVDPTRTTPQCGPTQVASRSVLSDVSQLVRQL